MPAEVIALAADHAGFEMKSLLKEDLEKAGYQIIDLGTDSGRSVDYPDFGQALAQTVTSGRARFGIAICGTGVGISIAANRIAGVRAALCHDGLTARLARQHNDANILALGARIVGIETARDCVRIFLAEKFAGAHHADRVKKLG